MKLSLGQFVGTKFHLCFLNLPEKNCRSEATLTDKVAFWTNKSGSKLEYKRGVEMEVTSAAKRQKKTSKKILLMILPLTFRKR